MEYNQIEKGNTQAPSSVTISFQTKNSNEWGARLVQILLTRDKLELKV